MTSIDKKFIKHDRLLAPFIPGVVQFENGAYEKGIFFIIGVMGFIFCIFPAPNHARLYLILAGIVYFFATVDSLTYYSEHYYGKRTLISKDTIEYLKKSNTYVPKTIPQNYIERGRKFEEFVLKHFNKNYFTIVRMTSPFQKSDGHYIESNQDPDYIFRYISSKEKFAIEAKFRSNYGNHEIISWSYPNQMARYNQFEKEEKIPLYLILGVGGYPENPNQMFLIPLRSLKSPDVSLKMLSKYVIKPYTPLSWQIGNYWNSGYLYQET